MVKTATIKQCNARYANEHHAGLVCVFHGATSGIGASTLERMALMLHTSTFYILGRSTARFASQRRRLESLSSGCKFVFLETEVSLLSDIDVACNQITTAEQKVDYLFMSAGFFPLNAPQYTKEGLETCFALSYYSRMRLVWNLLPLLHQSPRPRVLSVLDGGREKAMCDEDLGLEQHWSMSAVIKHTITMTSLAFEYLAENDKRIIFLHVAPGIVRTNIIARQTAPESSGIIWRVVLVLLRGFAAMMMLIIGISAEDSGERQAFHLTSDKYTPGAWRITSSSDLVSTPGVLEQYRERGWPERVWEHTVRIFDKALTIGSDNIPN